jgi:hypothetical protein
MKKHTLTLMGSSRGELRVPADALLETVSALLEGARQATRFFVEGESSRKGPRPAWLEAASRVDITGLAAGSAIVTLEAPTIAEAVPDRFGPEHQANFFFAEPQRPINTNNTVIDNFASVLVEAVTGARDRVFADRVLLDTCLRFARTACNGFEGVQFDNVAGRTEPFIVRKEDIPKIERLWNETPGPKAVRLAGTLDTISATRSDVVLKLADGETVAARLDDHDSETLKSLFGAQVVVSGMAHFRPSGKLLVIDVEHLGPARDADKLFQTVPIVRAFRPVASHMPQDETSGVSAFFGTWPGDETDEELLRALEAVR